MENIDRYLLEAVDQQQAGASAKKKPRSSSASQGSAASGKEGPLTFSELTRGADRKFASRCFLQLLHLKTQHKLEVAQARPYGEILVSAI